MMTQSGLTPFFFGKVPRFLADAPFADALDEFPDPSNLIASANSQRAMLLDVKETDAAIEVKADIPGIPKKDISVDINKHVLTLTVNHEEKSEESHTEGGKEDPKKASKEGAVAPTTKWHRTERSRVFVQRSIRLPESADTSGGDASYTDGVLTINFPKKALMDTTTKLHIA